MRVRRRTGLVVLLTVAVICLSVRIQRALPSRFVPGRITIALPPSAFAGAASCSARACHGGNSPASDGLLSRTEYTLWIESDPHAKAYSVLFGERSLEIMKKLPVRGRPPHGAHEDVRCLACHVEPHAAIDRAPGGRRLDGVGCEACHGPARNWIDPHTASAEWGKLSVSAKSRLGMRNVKDPKSLASVCVGCHVGAPADAENELPLRDVDHDLLAAGHPRLNFEFATFMANLPPHWKQGLEGPAWESGKDSRPWEAGQLASAQASLDLLADRVERAANSSQTGAWPEFAEYECSGCHHGLKTPSSRQRPEGASLHPGRLAWSSWYLKMPTTLLAKSSEQAQSFEALGRQMEQPFPSLNATAKLVRAASKSLQRIEAELVSKGKATSKHELLEKLKKLAPPENRLSWEQAEQFSLAGAWLRREALGRGDSTSGFLKQGPAAKDIFGKLAFPQGLEEQATFLWDDAFGHDFKAMLNDQPAPR
jgi:hypothetical protein